MPLSKTNQSPASVTVPAGTTASAPVATTSVEVEYGALAILRIQNGGSQPGTGAFAALQASVDQVNWYTIVGPYQAGTLANEPYDWPTDVTVNAIYIRAVAWGNLGAAVTLSMMVSRTDSF